MSSNTSSNGIEGGRGLRSSPSVNLDFTAKCGVNLLGHDCILRIILNHLDKRDQSTCLQLSKQFFSLAGEKVYHTITLSQKSFDAILRGWDKAEGISKARPTFEDNLRGSMQKKAAKKQTLIIKSTNFKAGLLSKVRHLTVTLHDHASCDKSYKAAKLFTNLDTLHIVPPRFDNVVTTKFVCPSLRAMRERNFDDAEACDFILQLNPRRIVFRNLGRQGLLISWYEKWNPDRLESVTYVISPSTDFVPFENFSAGDLEPDIANGFPKCPYIRIIFGYDLKTNINIRMGGRTFKSTKRDLYLSRNDPRSDWSRMMMEGPAPITEDRFVRFMRNILENPSRQYTIFGMEFVDLDGQNWRTSHGNRRLWNRVEKEIRRGVKVEQSTLVFRARRDYLLSAPQWELTEEDIRYLQRSVNPGAREEDEDSKVDEYSDEEEEWEDDEEPEPWGDDAPETWAMFYHHAEKMMAKHGRSLPASRRRG